MKKNAFYLFAALLFMGIAGLTSCEKYVASTPYVINDSISATVSGFVKASLDLSNTTTEYAPSGTKVFIKVSLQEYNPNAQAGEFKVYTTTVGTDGKYSFNLPSNDNGVNFTIYAEDFRYNQIQFDGSTVDKIFTAPSYNGFVISNQAYIQDINY